MRYWYSIDHDHHYPVGVASAIAAETEEEARKLLEAELIKHGLDPAKGYTLKEMPPNIAIVLCDGNY